MACIRYGLYSHGLYSYGLYSYGMYSYGLGWTLRFHLDPVAEWVILSAEITPHCVTAVLVNPFFTETGRSRQSSCAQVIVTYIVMANIVLAKLLAHRSSLPI